MSNRITTEFLDEYVRDGFDDAVATWCGDDDLEFKETFASNNFYQMYEFIDEKGYDTCDPDNQTVIYAWARQYVLDNGCDIVIQQIDIFINLLKQCNTCE